MAKHPISMTWYCGMSSRKVIPTPLQTCTIFTARSLQHNQPCLNSHATADASLQIWFDRNLDFGHGSLIDASLGNLPRLVTSRSIEKQHDDSRILQKLDVKIGVLERAIDNIGIDIKPMTSSAKLQLNKFLQIDD